MELLGKERFALHVPGGLHHSGRTGHRDDVGLGLLPGPSGVPAAVASFSCEYDRRSFVDASVGATGTAGVPSCSGAGVEMGHNFRMHHDSLATLAPKAA